MLAGGGAHQTAAQRGGEATKDKDRPLSDLQRERFEDLLRGITCARPDICDAMVFALDNAECASEVRAPARAAHGLHAPTPLRVQPLVMACPRSMRTFWTVGGPS